MKRKARNPMSVPISVALGLACAVVITLLLTASASWMIAKEKIDIGTIGYISLLITAAAAYTGCKASAVLARTNEVLVSGIFAGTYLIVLLSCTALLFGGTYHGVWKSLAVTGVCWLLSLISPQRNAGKGSKRTTNRGYR